MDIFKKQLEYCKITDYHEKGYKGKGIVIINHENGTYHATCSKNILKIVAPEATIIDASVQVKKSNGKLIYYNFEIDGTKYTPSEMYNKFKPNILSVSFEGSSDDELLEEQLKPLQKQGLIIINGAGNSGNQGVTAKYKNIAIKVGAVTFTANNNFTEPIIAGYSGYDINELNVDFMGFTGEYSGTSFSCPFVAGQIALLMNRFGIMNQSQIYEVLKNCAKDIYREGKDDISGYGIIIMPNKLGVVNMNFKDTQGHWAREEIEKAVNNNILNGYPDGTFKPEQTVTRAEMAVIIKRILEKVGK